MQEVRLFADAGPPLEKLHINEGCWMKQFLLFLGLAFLVVGCASHPKTRPDYIDMHRNYTGFGSSFLYNETINSGRAYSDTVSSVEKLIVECISTESTTRRDNIAGGWTANRYEYKTEEVTDDKYEVTIKNHTGAGLLFIIVADFTRAENGTANVEVFSQKNFENPINAFTSWVKGGEDCLNFTK